MLGFALHPLFKGLSPSEMCDVLNGLPGWTVQVGVEIELNLNLKLVRWGSIENEGCLKRVHRYMGFEFLYILQRKAEAAFA